MLEVNAPIGNIFLDKGFDEIKSGNFEKLKISRMELEKRILRRKGDRGTDVGFNLDPGVKLRHGDVIDNGNTKIVVEQLPEKVISIRLKTKNMVDVMVLLGHIIGNRHRPISIQSEEIVFPIQADSEKEVFTKLFHNIINHIEMTVDERIFSPHSGADVHEH
ncbi:urease accessory protein UreE [Candidatus Nitrosopumilus sediminis]|uniref:Urease accessory protein n=1 Tax=Candidatus Nitrosopumilus sediminis TaxID=1229909 RepID=K0BCY8_9ARCH|nr:urease accessory protein [Candidatus Nitrosopumilus sediminis]AFS83324.1 Urease accessory protein [Candidatus Nitrosopumilus sediminis]